MARSARQSARVPGSLRLVTKKARGHEYTRWQWRTRRRDGDRHLTFDLELGEYLTCMRTRVYVALGELSAPLLVERWARHNFKDNDGLPAYTGRPESTRSIQRVAWWLEIPRKESDRVRLRFRALVPGIYDFRRDRPTIAKAEAKADEIWRELSDDPILQLARLQWFEQESQAQIDSLNEQLVDLRRQRRQGELSQRDYEADERSVYLYLEPWEDLISWVRGRWDELLAEMIAALPRNRQEPDRSRIVARADRLLNDPKQRNAWHAKHWDDGTLSWSR